MASSSLRNFGPFRLDPARACLWRHDQLLPLPPKPFAVLAHLVAHAGEVVTKEALLDAVWPATAVSEGVLKTCMGQIRQALGDTARTPRYIETVHRRGYRFIAPVSLAASAQTAPGAAPLAEQPLVPPGPGLIAREPEFAALQRCWAAALQHRRQFVFVTGEAGIGKTALIDAFVSQVMSASGIWTARGQCIEQYGSGEAYLPILEALGQLGRGPDGAQVIELLRRQAPSWLLQMPALVADDEYEALQRHSGGATRERMLRELAEAMQALTTERPLVLVLEDLHWSDYATLDWLAFVARHRAPARLLVLGTYRPADAIVRAHPVHTVAQELQRQGQATELVLPYLSAAGVAAYLVQRFGAGQLQPEFMRVLHHRTNGNPFFLVTVVDELIRQGIFAQTDHGLLPQEDLEAIAREVPESVRQLIDQQLAHLSPEELELLEAASVVGVEFSAAAVAAGVDRTPDEVEERCDTLERHGQFVRSCGTLAWPDGTIATRYRFTHDLYHEIFYGRVPTSRRLRWHRQIGRRLEAAYGSQAPSMAAELAMHFVRGHDLSRAVHYLRYAAEQALRRSAHQEAMAHLRRGLALLHELPESSERAERELVLQTALGSALVATRGWAAPEVEQTYERAHALCRQLGEPPQLFAVLYGLYELHEYRGEFETSRQFGEQLLGLAQRRRDATLLLGSHETLACTLFHVGGFAQALAQTEQGLTLYDPRQHYALLALYGRDLGIACRYWRAAALWFQGYAEQALRCSEEAITLAQDLAHPYSLAAALGRGALLRQCRRESQATSQWAEAALTLATEHGFPSHAAMGMILRGWALAMHGHAAAGTAQIQQGLATLRNLGREMDRPYFLALLAEACASAAQLDDARAAVDEALTSLHGDRDFFFVAELYRLRGELLLAADCGRQQAASAPEASLLQALDIARRQHAKSLELRTAVSLGRLWQHQGKRDQARRLLLDLYGWFTEGFDTADLRQAKALLDALTP